MKAFLCFSCRNIADDTFGWFVWILLIFLVDELLYFEELYLPLLIMEGVEDCRERLHEKSCNV